MAVRGSSWLAGLVSVSAVLLGARVAGAAAGFTTHVLLARQMPADRLGLYFLAVSAVSIAAAVAAMGYPSIMARFISRYAASRRPVLAAGFVRHARADTVRNAAIAIPFAAAFILYGAGHGAGAAAVLGWVAVSVPALAMMRINGSLGTALRMFKIAYLPDVLVRPAAYLALVGAAALVLDSLTLAAVLTIFALLAAATALGQHLLLDRLRPLRAPRTAPTPGLARIWRQTSRPFLVVTLVASFFVDLQLLLVSATIAPAEVAVVGICLKMAFLLAFVVDVVHEFPARDIGDAVASGDGKTLATRIAMINGMAMAVSIAVVGLVALFGETLLAVFGADYARHHNLLLLFVLPQAIRSAFGPNVMLLTLTGGQHLIRNIYLAGLGLMALTVFGLTERYGMIGSGIAVVVFFASINLALSVALVRRTGLRADLWSSIRFLAAARPMFAPAPKRI